MAAFCGQLVARFLFRFGTHRDLRIPASQLWESRVKKGGSVGPPGMENRAVMAVSQSYGAHHNPQ